VVGGRTEKERYRYGNGSGAICRHARTSAHTQEGNIFNLRSQSLLCGDQRVVFGFSVCQSVHVLCLPPSFDCMKLRKKRTDWTCCNNFEHTRTTMQQQQRRRRRPHGYSEGPQSWIALKSAVGIAIAIIGYCSYVYVGRFCLFMIQKRRNALGGKAMGSEYSSVTQSSPILLRSSRFPCSVRRPAANASMDLYQGMAVQFL
jgi:hypothetical protein